MDWLKTLTVTDIYNIHTVASPKGRQETIRNRICYGLSFCMEGQISYFHNGKQYVSDRDHAILLPQGQTYTLHGDKKGRFPVINFYSPSFLCDTHIVLPIRTPDVYIKDYERMKALFLFENNRAKVMSIFYHIIDRLIADQLSPAPLLKPIVSYLEAHYADASLSNESIARECGISEVYFRKLFTESYGITPKQYIIDLRITKAKHLLCDGGLKINAIADACGFSNPFHFCRVFKEKTGLTPTEYMKENRIFEI